MPPTLMMEFEPTMRFSALKMPRGSPGRCSNSRMSLEGVISAVDPRDYATRIEQNPVLPDDERERFRGYALIGQPFRSGHVLGLRRFPASSIGPAYTSIWHQDPQGHWTFYVNVSPEFGCNRYYGADIDTARECPIEITWTGPRSLTVNADEGHIDWRIELQSTAVTKMMSGLCDHLPTMLWHQGPVLTALGSLGGRLLDAGKLRLQGHTSNNQRFEANPRRVWVVPESRASLGGVDLGEVGMSEEQSQLGDFQLPQRGLFVVADAYMEPFDPSRHYDRVTRTQSFDREVAGAGVRRAEERTAVLR